MPLPLMLPFRHAIAIIYAAADMLIAICCHYAATLIHAMPCHYAAD